MDKSTYICSNGHEVSTPLPLAEGATCPAYIKGKPCGGEMKQLGRGTRKRKDETKEDV